MEDHKYRKDASYYKYDLWILNGDDLNDNYLNDNYDEEKNDYKHHASGNNYLISFMRKLIQIFVGNCQ